MLFNPIRFVSRAIALCALVIVLAACANHPPFTAQNQIDLDQFAGKWYTIANIPYFMEANKVATSTYYQRVKGNQFIDTFEFREGGFEAAPKQWVGSAKSLGAANTEWQSVFFWVLRSRFSIVHMDDDYQMMLVGVRSRNLGWVFSREKTLSDADYERALIIFEQQGYNPTEFVKVPQFESQVGLPGFQQPG